LKARLLILLLVGILVLAIVPVMNSSAQGGDAAKMDSLTLSSIPPQQSVGGELEFRVNFNVYGGCCYHLWVYNAVPEVDFPPEFQLISGPSPETMEEIDGLPGGEPCPQHFSWKGIFSKAGTYKIAARVVSDNSGIIEGVGEITILSGPAISMPITYPSTPDSNKELQISVDIISPTLGVDVTSVKMYQLISDEPYDDAKAELDMLTVFSGGYSRTFPGTEKELQRSEKYPNTYVAIYPAFKENKYVYYWYVAKDSDGMVITSSVNEAKVTDIQGTYNKVTTVFLSFIVSCIVGIFLIIFVHMKVERRRVRDKTKLYRLGSAGNAEYLSKKDTPKPARPVLYYVVFALLLIIAIAFIYYAHTNGGLAEISQFIRDGK
jgi:hypothetical protein